DLAGDRQPAHQVGHEEDGAVEDADEEEVAARVVGRDLLAPLRDAPLERLAADQDRGAGALELGRAHDLTVRSAVTAGWSTMPGTAITSDPRTTRGQASRSDFGIF